MVERIFAACDEDSPAQATIIHTYYVWHVWLFVKCYPRAGTRDCVCAIFYSYVYKGVHMCRISVCACKCGGERFPPRIFSWENLFGKHTRGCSIDIDSWTDMMMVWSLVHVHRTHPEFCLTAREIIAYIINKNAAYRFWLNKL